MSTEVIIEAGSASAAQWITMLMEPTFAIPLLGAWMVGFLVSLTGIVANRKTQKAKNLIVYLTNAVVAAGIFNLLNESDTHTMVNLSIMLSAVAVIIPWSFFEVYKKLKK